jgi:exopolysaccharide biosynthesis polyprenyl glycosylphosphotransferase
VVSDACALVGAYALAAGAVGMGPGVAQIALFACALVVWLLGMGAYGLYARPALGEPRAVPGLGRIAVAATVGAWLWFGAARLLGSHPPTPSQAYLFWALAIAFLVLGRMLTGAVLRRRDPEPDTLVVLGSGPAARRVARKVRREPRYGVRVLGFADDATTADGKPDRTPVLCAPHELPALVASHGIQRVVVAGSGASWPDVVADLRRAGVSVDVVPPLPGEVGLDGRLHGLEEVPLIGLAPARRTRWSLGAKRALDVVLAGAALAALAPVFAFVAWRVRRTSPGPVFFRQARLGRHMREFTLLKFRTMWVDTPSDPHRDYVRSISRSTAEPEDSGLYKLARADAVTPTGRWLRRTSLDELPQLINVLRGDMSIVGPRPCLAHELECFEPRHYERFALPAGITGLWQVTARARATFDEALDFDVAYVRSWSLGLDLRILVRTPVEMLRPHQTA